MKNNIFSLWIIWFYFKAPKEIIRGWFNYLRFNSYYFSVETLFKTFFYYWRGYYWSYPRGLGFEHFEVFVSNMFSRLIGALMRSVLIIIGVISAIIIFFLGVIILLLWLILPLILVFLLLLGLSFI